MDTIAVLSPDSTKTPSPPLWAITLPSPLAVPPIVLPDAPLTHTPKDEFPRAPVPLMSVPMRLPWIKFPVVPTRSSSSMKIPILLPEMTFPSPGAGPPMRLFVGPSKNEAWSQTPIPLDNEMVPDTSVPMRFPCTRFPAADAAMFTPIEWPEITLRDPGEAPPMTLFVET